MLTLTDITLRRGPNVLFEGLSLAVHPGWRLGVVGRNGTGKSSLFALLLGGLGPDSGEVSLPRGLSIATVAQETPSTRESALDYVLDGDAELRSTERALASAEAADDAHAMAAAHERLNEIGGYAAHARAGSMLNGLGFSAEAQARPVSDFSGGWRMRLNLARALMQRSDLLLLDEPTNHLDLDAVLWLQRTLAEYEGTLLVISHDRDFLDATTTHTLHLHNRRARLYTGNYSSFEAQRAEQLAVQAAQYEKQQKQIAHMQQFVDRFRAKASKARQAQARLKMIERMPKVAPVHADSGFDVEFREPARLPTPLLKLDDVAVGYDGVPLLTDVDVTLAPGDRIGLLGANGAGKSTLMRLLAGELGVLAGEYTPHTHLTVGYFAQHQLDQLDSARSPLDHLLDVDPKLAELDARKYLGSFAFRGDRVFEPVRLFSGGERARLVLALVVYQRPNLLLLDEPTNHLDLDMRHALEVALQEFAGAVVTVSHDRHLIRTTSDTLWLVADGGVRSFDGDLDDYARWLNRRDDKRAGVPGRVEAAAYAAHGDAAAAAVESSGAAGRTAGADAGGGGGAGAGAGAGAGVGAGANAGRRPSAKERRRAAADQRAREKSLRDTLRRLDKQMSAERSRLAEIESALADPASYGGDASWDGTDMAALLKEQADLKRRLETAEEEWLEAAEALERGTAG